MFKFKIVNATKFVFILVVTVFLTLILLNSSTQNKMAKLVGCEFEVFGLVQEPLVIQDLLILQHTQKQANLFKLRGFCFNTRDDTVKGQMEGELNQINEMKHWLQHKGSPSSRIDKVVFSDLKDLKEYSFKDFSIKR